MQHLATVKCIYCIALKPRPVDLPYPYTTEYVPRLENKADAFFRFNEAYQKLLQEHQQQQQHAPSPDSADVWRHGGSESEEEDGEDNFGEVYSDRSRSGDDERNDDETDHDEVHTTRSEGGGELREAASSAPRRASAVSNDARDGTGMASDAVSHSSIASNGPPDQGEDAGNEDGDVVDDAEAFFNSEEDEA